METQDISKNEAKYFYARGIVRRRKMKKIAGWVIAAAIATVAILWGVRYAREYERNLPGQFFPNQGQEHVALDYQFSYSSNPPASGPHFPSPANWGIYDYEVHDKLFIHNLEHGGIWISYRPSVDAHVVEHLKAIVDEFGGSKIVMAPRSANDSDVVVAAWTRVVKFDLAGGDISEEQLNQIRAFYKTYKNRGPESVPDTMPGVDPKTVQ